MPRPGCVNRVVAPLADQGLPYQTCDVTDETAVARAFGRKGAGSYRIDANAIFTPFRAKRPAQGKTVTSKFGEGLDKLTS